MIDIRDRIPSGYTGRFLIPDPTKLEAIAIHHSVSGWAWQPETQRYTVHWNEALDATAEMEIAHLLAIDRWHSLPNNDWGGFGYHVAVFASGRSYLVGSLNTARAHVASLNPYFIGLVMIGDFSHAIPLPYQLMAANHAIDYIRNYHRSWQALGAEAHRNIRLQNTTCPGECWREWVPQLGKEEDMTLSTMDKVWILQNTGLKYIKGSGPRVYNVDQKGKSPYPGDHRDFSREHDWDEVIAVDDAVLNAIPDAP